jgi:2-iminobutanoate/2-iminopropanoate deaminase
MKMIYTSPDAPLPLGPYSHGVSSGGSNILFVSGQVGINRQTGQVIDDTIENETRQVMKNIAAILSEAGMNFENILKTTIYLKDLKNFSQVNEVYGSCFSRNFPARETVEVSGLPMNVNVEISVIAAK